MCKQKIVNDMAKRGYTKQYGLSFTHPKEVFPIDFFSWNEVKIFVQTIKHVY